MNFHTNLRTNKLPTKFVSSPLPGGNFRLGKSPSVLFSKALGCLLYALLAPTAWGRVGMLSAGNWVVGV